MPTRRIILHTIAYFIAVCLTTSRFAGAGPAVADEASARAFISAIYNSYIPDGADPVRIDSGRKLRRYFEPALAEAMNKDQENAAKHHDEGELGSDPFIDAQDWDFKHFEVAIKDTAPGKATATVTFVNLGKQKTIVLELIAIKNDWRIYDIRWQRDSEPKAPATLRAVFALKPNGAPTSAH